MTITERLKDRPVYAGRPIPYTTLVVKGVPDFKATDMDRWAECIQDKLCAICGQKLDYWVWYIGGPSCADQGLYFDLAMHEECMAYSAATCPFLAHGKDYATHHKDHPGRESVTHVNVSPDRPREMYASKRRRDQVEVIRDGKSFLAKTGPEVERVLLTPVSPQEPDNPYDLTGDELEPL